MDNELIAEFMPDMEFVTPRNKGYKSYWKNKGTLAEYKPEALKYHKSWDWLMPVVEKIEAMDWEVEIRARRCVIEQYPRQ